MDHNIYAVMETLDELIEWAQQAERECSDIYQTCRRIHDEPDEDLMDAEGRLSEYTRRIFQELRLFARVVNLADMVPEIKQTEEKYGDLTGLEVDPEAPIFWSGALREALRIYRSLSSVAGADALPALTVFHNMLDQTGRLIADLGLVPRNETEVRNTILRTIKYAFPDARKEQHATNNITHFRMDVAVPSLKAVAEYKFADTAEAVQECLDGIYADMTGYNGSSEWKYFFAVIYMSGPYRTQREVSLEFKRVKAKGNWTPVVVVGPGQRESRQRKAPAQP